MNRIRNLRCLKSLAVLLTIFGLVFAITAAGQTQRARRVIDEPQQPQPPQQPKQEPQKPQQQKPSEKKPTPEPTAETIRINSNLVAVPVSVTDAQGNPVRNLTAEDFLVEEEGSPQILQTLGEPGKTPIELALLFDVSRSVRNRFDFERETAGRFLREVMKPGDAVSIFSIGTTPKLSVQRTNNAESAIAATASIQPTEEATAFFDTVVRASQYLNDSSNPGVRRVMVVISDGEDTFSERFSLCRRHARIATRRYALLRDQSERPVNQTQQDQHKGP